MSIWFTESDLQEIKRLEKGNLLEHMGIEVTEVGEDFVKGRMPVDHRTRQPDGILHGGASVALAESLGSIASSLVIDRSKSRCVGIEINANHLCQVTSGFVHGTARPIHLGRKIHVWGIEIVNEQHRPVCTSRITLAVINKND